MKVLDLLKKAKLTQSKIDEFALVVSESASTKQYDVLTSFFEENLSSLNDNEYKAFLLTIIERCESGNFNNIMEEDMDFKCQNCGNDTFSEKKGVSGGDQGIYVCDKCGWQYQKVTGPNGEFKWQVYTTGKNEHVEESFKKGYNDYINQTLNEDLILENIFYRNGYKAAKRLAEQELNPVIQKKLDSIDACIGSLKETLNDFINLFRNEEGDIEIPTKEDDDEEKKKEGEEPENEDDDEEKKKEGEESENEDDDEEKKKEGEESEMKDLTSEAAKRKCREAYELGKSKGREGITEAECPYKNRVLIRKFVNGFIDGRSSYLIEKIERKTKSFDRNLSESLKRLYKLKEDAELTKHFKNFFNKYNEKIEENVKNSKEQTELYEMVAEVYNMRMKNDKNTISVINEDVNISKDLLKYVKEELKTIGVPRTKMIQIEEDIKRIEYKNDNEFKIKFNELLINKGLKKKDDKNRPKLKAFWNR